MHNPLPYFGITGFMSQETEMLPVLKSMRLPPNRLLMAGVLTSLKRLKGIPIKWPGRYPEPEQIKHIFVDHPRVLNLIHYATDDKKTLPAQIDKLIELGGPHLDGFQFNLAWPDIAHLSGLLKRVPRIVLQLGSRAIEEGGPPQELSHKLDHYDGLITDILFDPSSGKGLPFNTEQAREYLDRIMLDHPMLGVGCAGGLSPETLHLIEPLMRLYPGRLSTDAEERLRDQPTDSLNLERSTEYLRLQSEKFQ